MSSASGSSDIEPALSSDIEMKGKGEFVLYLVYLNKKYRSTPAIFISRSTRDIFLHV